MVQRRHLPTYNVRFCLASEYVEKSDPQLAMLHKLGFMLAHVIRDSGQGTHHGLRVFPLATNYRCKRVEVCTLFLPKHLNRERLWESMLIMNPRFIEKFIIDLLSVDVRTQRGENPEEERIHPEWFPHLGIVAGK